MPLDKNRLGNAIADVIKNARPDAGVALSDNALKTMWVDIADAIVEEIKQGQVSTTVTGTAATNMGPAPVTGTGMGSIT